MIVFSAKVSKKHQDKLQTSFPNQSFVFCDSAQEVKQHIGEAEVYVTFGDDVDEALLASASKLKWIQILSAGIDGLPFDVLQNRNIIVTNARGIHGIQMSEYAISMLLQVYRQAKEVIRNEEKQVWDKSVRINEISNKTMIIVGTGAIGSEVARLAKAFRMHTIGVSKTGRTLEFFDENYSMDMLNEVLPKADFIVSVLPSTGETKDIYAWEQFKKMKNGAVFLNMGRGDAVVEDDLLTAIRKQEISHAILDVVKEEPLPESHPFWKEENITITPHFSGVSPEYVKRALAVFEDNLNCFIEGKDCYINQINLSRGY
ncbi:D-2-hydroxyacid dehydrogenase [Oceanobacillus senegalensis]|uniref:D-2-hydroxyacid dehydrogenase n=1 Tax=Oceanobacillus senegalensis TaxID=1936063 RepID=UPI000A309CDC|nr:D-2-hydroxyacid dehydrogenase [Oceanobacillus senegalensis]